MADENESNTPDQPEPDQPEPEQTGPDQTRDEQPSGGASGQQPEDAASAADQASDLASDVASQADEGADMTDEEAQALQQAMSAIGDATGEAEAAGAAPAPTSDKAPPPDATPYESPEFSDGTRTGKKHEIDLLSDVHMDVRIELGRTRMFVEDVLKLGDGAVVELDKLAGDPVDVFVNDRKVAKGEVLVLNDNFCVRINEIVDLSEA